jgi:phosphoglycolate phosphatase
MNAALQRFGFPAHPVEAYRYFVGDSVDSLVRRTLPKDHLNDENIEKCRSSMLDEYSRRWSVNTKPYPQIPELLRELEVRDIPKAVLSNKPDNFTKLTVKELLAGFSFDIVQGVSDTVTRKPDTAAALGIAEKLKIAPADFLYLGDTNTDMQTAVAAGMYPVGALWGFRTAGELKKNGAKILVEKPLDVLKVLDSK